MKNILISNDDGVLGPGILANKQALEDFANVTVVAPQENNSAVGRKVNIMKHMYGLWIVWNSSRFCQCRY